MKSYVPTRRDELVVFLANLVLHLASKKYRLLLNDCIKRGMLSALAESRGVQDQTP